MMAKIAAALIVLGTLLSTSAVRAEVCAVIGGTANVANTCACPGGNTKKPMRTFPRSFICDDGSAAVTQVMAGKICCLATPGSGTELCKQIGAKYQWMIKNDCRAAPQGAECPVRLCQ
jgi:hypothetical protein